MSGDDEDTLFRRVYILFSHQSRPESDPPCWIFVVFIEDLNTTSTYKISSLVPESLENISHDPVLVPQMFSASDLVSNLMERISHFDRTIPFTIARDILSSLGSINYRGLDTAYQWVNSYLLYVKTLIKAR